MCDMSAFATSRPLLVAIGASASAVIATGYLGSNCTWVKNWRRGCQPMVSACRRPCLRLIPRANVDSDDSSRQPRDNDKNDDDGHRDIPQSSVDWNAEWSKFANEGMTSSAPKGREPPSATERAARRAATAVKSRVGSVTSKLPSRRALFGDWRFWIAVIFALSVLTAAVGNSHSNQLQVI